MCCGPLGGSKDERRSRSGFRIVSNGCECELVVMPERKGPRLYNVIVIGAGTVNLEAGVGTAVLGGRFATQPAAEGAGRDLIKPKAPTNP